LHAFWSIESTKPFDCVVLNNNKRISTFKEFYREMIDFLPEDGIYNYYDDLPETLKKPVKHKK
jgi:hypothetical protein